jgi:Type IV secretory system Conjugative DNA transfer
VPSLLIERRVLESLAVGAAHLAVILVEPQHDLDLRRELLDHGVKAAPGMHELRAASDEGVDDHLLAGTADHLDDTVLHQIPAHRDKRRRPVVDHEMAVLGQDALDHPVHFANVDLLAVVLKDLHRANAKRCDVLERAVHLICVVTRGADKERLRPVVRLLLTMAMRVLMAVELKFADGQPVTPHKHRLLMMLDEFPSLGRMQLLEGALPKCAGYGIKAFLAAQDREQMFRAYGEHQSITANCHVRIIYAPNEWSTAKWVSEMVGNTTIVKQDVTESGTRFGPLRNVSRTYHQLSRPLLTPDEIMKLKKPLKADDGRIFEAGEMVVFVAGEPPIAGTQILYFTDPVFVRRAAIPAPPSSSTLRPSIVFRAG